MEPNKTSFAETVMVVDAACLNFVVEDMKRYFESKLGRVLQPVDLGLLAMLLAKGAGVESRAENEVQVLFAYDGQSDRLLHCVPSDLKTELNGTAFRGEMGEFSFLSVPSEGLVERRDLFPDLLQLALSAPEVKRLVLVPFVEEYGEAVDKLLKEYAEGEEAGKAKKEIVCFRMTEPLSHAGYTWKMLGYPLMMALGIRGEEL